MLSAAIFDMDGLLADTEPLWHEVECAAYAAVGLNITAEECMQTMGMRVDEAVGYWYARAPWSGASPADVTRGIVADMVAAIRLRTAPMTGATDLVRRLRARGWGLALASSSPYAIIEAVLDTCGFTESFDVVHSAQDEDFGKPHPAIYLTTAGKLGVTPQSCLALEDSANGLVAAKAARMRCVVVPMPGARQDPRWGLADLVVDSLEGVDDAAIEALAAG
jgi:sugar-phosphatase